MPIVSVIAGLEAQSDSARVGTAAANILGNGKPPQRPSARRVPLGVRIERRHLNMDVIRTCLSLRL
ncbi:MAG: hypothetical protein LC797_08820 [Chloroflexi bacterium]|nr:hypothetical protein [Chloroflexota bacterium]